MATQQDSGRWIFLSYPLSKDTPAYGGEDGALISPVKQMATGDTCNTGHWSFPNHLGTHLDCPRHFTAQGNTIDDYGADFFIFRKVAVLDLGNVEGGEIISCRGLEGQSIPKDIELLIIKTGFHKKRELPDYWRNNPGFSPDLADLLRATFPSLRTLGFDSISLTSYAHREFGREAHRRFLDHSCPILLLEDMALAEISAETRFELLIVAPWMVSGADAVPCTVMAATDNRV